MVTSAALPDGPLLEGSLGENPLQPEPAAPTGTLIPRDLAVEAAGELKAALGNAQAALTPRDT
jgi:hypothetical protein